MTMYKGGPPPTTRVDTTLKTDHTETPRQAAAGQAHDNIKSVFEVALAAVRVSTPTRDVSQNQRSRYELNWQKLRDAAARYKLVARVPVLVPVYHAPPSTGEDLVEFEPAPEPTDKYHETGGRKIPAGITPADPAWWDIQGHKMPETAKVKR
jgi:hypothetical protein